MRVPARVAIGPYTYEVKEVPDPENPKTPGVAIWGYCDTQNLTIYLDADAKDERKRETFLHEVIHAMSEVMGRSLSEQAVFWLGIALTEFLQRNPEVVAMFAPATIVASREDGRR